MTWFVYILQCADNTLYTGVTTDIERRLKEHNTSLRGARYTKARRPVKLIYFESSTNRSMAQSREFEIRHLSKNDKLKLAKTLDKNH